MRKIAEKLKEVEIEITQEKGNLSLFALFLREDAPDVWDLLISAPWARINKSDALKYVAGKIRKKLDNSELLKLSRIVILEGDDPAVQAFQRGIKVEHGIAEIQNSNFLGLPIKHAYLITSKRDPVPTADPLLKKASG